MDGVLWFDALTVIGGYDLTSTPMARLLIDAAMRKILDGDEPVATQIESVHEATCSRLILGQESGSDIDDEDLRVYLSQSWDAIVTADPPLANGYPPGLMTLSVGSPEFDEYLREVALHWRDTSEPIDLRTAQLLRVILQYLVAACSGSAMKYSIAGDTKNETAEAEDRTQFVLVEFVLDTYVGRQLRRSASSLALSRSIPAENLVRSITTAPSLARFLWSSSTLLPHATSANIEGDLILSHILRCGRSCDTIGETKSSLVEMYTSRSILPNPTRTGIACNVRGGSIDASAR